jgi:type II secretory pathway pseudopilin PulG
MKGFALTETLVALAIAGLIVTTLVWLQVNYLALAKRTVAQGRPALEAAALRQAARSFDNCAYPNAVLARSDPGLALRTADGDVPLTSLPPKTSAHVVAALGPDGRLRDGWSSAAIARNGVPVAVLAQRCDLPEVCNYDMAKDQC